MMFSVLKITLLGATLATAAPTIPTHIYLNPIYNATTNTTYDPRGWNATTANNTAAQQATVNIATIFPDGIAPIFMAHIEDPVAEYSKCDFDICEMIQTPDCAEAREFLDRFRPEDCKFTELFEAATAAGALPVSAVEVPDWDNPSITKPHPFKPGHGAALERRQVSECPKKCAPFAALPPFGAWFAMCMADCAGRCSRGLSCP